MITYQLSLTPPGSHTPPSPIMLEPGDTVDISIGHYRNGQSITWRAAWFNRTGETVRLEFTEWKEAPDDDTGLEDSTQELHQVRPE